MPQFEHDCDECTFVGHYKGIDIYTCPQNTMPTVVARYGSDGPEYTSGQTIKIDDLTLTIDRPPFEVSP